jgi:hypothetical protein
MEKHGGMISTGELICPPELYANPTSSHLVAKQEKRGEGNDEFGLRLFIIQSEFFTCSKILRQGADGFTSLPKEGELRISIAL